MAVDVVTGPMVVMRMVVGCRQQPATDAIGDQSETGNPSHDDIRSDKRELTDSNLGKLVRESLPTVPQRFL